MRRFLTECLLFALLQFALLALLAWKYYDVRHVAPLSPATIIKHQRLNTAPSPRMILIGGSNLLFGIDSPMIEQQTPYHAVNMGLAGGLRLEFTINEISDSLRPGDLVVMSLEYNTLNAETESDDPQALLSVAARRPGNLRFFTWAQWRGLLDHGALAYAGIVFRQCVENIGAGDNNENPGIQEDMNEFGDLTRYHDPNVKPRKQGEQKTLVKVRVEGVEANIRRMNAFIADCRSRGVAVMFAYPPLCRTHYERGRDLARRFDRLLRRELDAPVICRPEDVVWDDANFIGRSYHLRGTAVQERTQRLIDAVKAQEARASAATKSAR